MKIKHSGRWKRRTAAQQAEAAYRWIARLLWGVLPVFGIISLFTYGISPDHRQCSLFPTPVTASIQQTADRSLANQAPGRDAMLRSVTNTIAATGGFLIRDIYLTDQRLLEQPQPLDPAKLSDTADQLNLLYQKLQIPMCVIAVPSAGELYAQELLDGVQFPSQLPEIETFYQQMDSPIRKIDVYHVLYTLTDNYIYNRTDPRWTCYGAYCVYRTAIQKMGFSPVSFDQYIVTHVDTYRGSLYDACLYDGVTPDVLDVYSCKSGSTVTQLTAYQADGTEESREMYVQPDTGDPYAFYLGEDCEKLVIETDLENQRKLLVLKDAYANCMIPFLLQHYSEICVLDVTCMEHALAELADVSEYSQILVLCDADTFANDAYFDFFET